MSTPPLVLVADDEPSITRLVNVSLSQEGFRVVTAHSGESALAIDEELRPDIVILGLSMPDLDGIEVMRLMRDRRRIPVILLSTRGSTADKARGLDLGADDYLAKPFQPDELAARVRAILRRTMDRSRRHGASWASTTSRSTSAGAWSAATASSSTSRARSGCC